MPEPLHSVLIRLGLQVPCLWSGECDFLFLWGMAAMSGLDLTSAKLPALLTADYPLCLIGSLLMGSLLKNTSEVFCWSLQHGHILINYSLKGILVKDVLRLIHSQIVLGETTSRLRSKYVKICVTCSPLHDLVNMFWNPYGILPILEVLVLFENFVLTESRCSFWIYLLYFNHC